MFTPTTEERTLQRSKLVTISGNIGSGKSKLLEDYEKYLLEKGKVYPVVILERVNGNDLLSSMYEDPSRWTFTLQVDFMLHKYNAYMRGISLVSRSTDVIIFIERDFRDFLIFAEFQFKKGHMNVDEYDTYLALYKILDSQIQSALPRGGLKNYYLDTPAEICETRVMKRGREFEKKVCDQNYLLQLSIISANFYKERDTICIPYDYDMNTLDSLFLEKRPEILYRGGELHSTGVILSEEDVS